METEYLQADYTQCGTVLKVVFSSELLHRADQEFSDTSMPQLLTCGAMRRALKVSYHPRML